ncbi:MAG: hypothetical protein PHG82_04490 [Candidatus Gracilibacteria bacterium]|nr:hypothetical protein [Candidatus Gracilibacteria bacterium]
MKELETLALEATKNILEKNLQIYNPDLIGKKVVLVYDTDSVLSRLISAGYIENLKAYPNTEIILYSSINSADLREKLISLEEGRTVVMVESTNFRLEEFRIRINLQKRKIAQIEHNHLVYIKEHETQTYLEAISYQTPYFQKVSDFLKEKVESGNTMKIIAPDGTTMTLEGGFENMKQNTGNFPLHNRYGTLPMGENFSEVKDFSKVNGELYIRAYPLEDLQVRICETPFKVSIKESMITYDKDQVPAEFYALMNKIVASEGEIMIRELGFGLNRAIDFTRTLSDVNPFERLSGFHLSLGKKHNIYRKKLATNIVQRYHIDVFPLVSEIYIDDELVFDSENHYAVK